MEFIYNDGGRSNYFKIDRVGDCCVRAICNASGMDYMEVYNGINEIAKHERRGTRKRNVSNARNGVYSATARKYIEGVLGWEWVPCMEIGSGCRVHLNYGELPDGDLIVRVSKHYTCVKDGVIYDTWDCSREGERCVYGYWKKPDGWKPKKEQFTLKKIKTHEVVEYDITYKWNGIMKTVRIESRDGKLNTVCCNDGFILGSEYNYIKTLVEGGEA